MCVFYITLAKTQSCDSVWSVLYSTRAQMFSTPKGVSLCVQYVLMFPLRGTLPRRGAWELIIICFFFLRYHWYVWGEECVNKLCWVPWWTTSRVVVLETQVPHFTERERRGQQEHINSSSLKHRLVRVCEVVYFALPLRASQLHSHLHDRNKWTDINLCAFTL